MVSPAGPGDLPEIEALLRACGLPTEGVAEILPHMIVARDSERLLGCAGLELHGEACVLRSLAVTPDARGRGIARPLIEGILALARRAGAREAWLLTYSIEPLARRYGFQRVDRDRVPAALLQAGEFGLTLCKSATIMRKDLDSPLPPRV
jgi:amino-acid N-acetyltransferase